jgi:DNA-binding MarR family transcriptional regulator
MSSLSEREQFVERMGGALTAAGVARLPSRIFSALLIDEDGRMTAAELAETLQVSPGAVSGAVRYLDGVGMIRRERERGSRRDIFVVDDDAWHNTMLRADQYYAPMQAALDRALGDLSPGDPAYRRLRLSREFLTFILEEMASLHERWDQRIKELGL